MAKHRHPPTGFLNAAHGRHVRSSPVECPEAPFRASPYPHLALEGSVGWFEVSADFLWDHDSVNAFRNSSCPASSMPSPLAKIAFDRAEPLRHLVKGCLQVGLIDTEDRVEQVWIAADGAEVLVQRLQRG